MDGREPDDVDQLHAHLSDALIACYRCISNGRRSESDLMEVAKLLTAAQSKLFQCRLSQQTSDAHLSHKP